jgi:MinD-like ATPase involved in chromosome partitioning or flagellar assembly
MEHDQRALEGGPARPKVHLVGVHSVRGGSGKTTLASNLGYLAARAGARVAIVDADLQAPALHVVLGVGTKRILHSVSEFVKGQCEIGEVPIDLTHELSLDGKGALFFLPASTDLQTVASLLFDGYDVARLNRHLLQLAADLDLDYLILDTHLGFNRETLLSVAICNTVLVLLRPDGQDSLGSVVLVQTARKLGVPSCVLVPNMVGASSSTAELAEKIEKALGAPVGGVLPWCAELFEAGSRSLFTFDHPEHPFSVELERIAQRVAPSPLVVAGGAA